MAEARKPGPVLAEALTFFRGEFGEGLDGMVSPGDVLALSRDRAAALKANRLVIDYVPPVPPEPLAEPPAELPAETDMPARSRPARHKDKS